MSTPGKRKTKNTGSKPKGKAAPKQAAEPAANVAAPPAAGALAVHAAYDREKQKWFWSIREDKEEHWVEPNGCDSEEKAHTAGAKWLARYAKANAAAKRKMLGWTAATSDAAHVQAIAKADQENARLRDERAESKDGMTASERAMAKGAKAGKGKGKGKNKAKGAKPAKERKTSGLDAAAQVLKDAGEPMKCGDIVATMLDKGMWKTSGKTPAATIYTAWTMLAKAG